MLRLATLYIPTGHSCPLSRRRACFVGISPQFATREPASLVNHSALLPSLYDCDLHPAGLVYFHWDLQHTFIFPKGCPAMMSRIFLSAVVAGLAVVVTGCSSGAMTMVSPSSSLSLHQGTGSTMRSPDGETSFRYVISNMVYSDYSPDERKAQHEYLIGSWVGTEGICPDGYNVSRPEEASGAFIYTGVCK